MQERHQSRIPAEPGIEVADQAFDQDTGWRIDYQLATPSLATAARVGTIDRAPTYAERFSDHAPFVVDYDV